MKMNETILAQVKRSDEKYNIRYAKKDGSLYSGLKNAFFFFFAYAAIFAAFVVLGIWFNEEIQYNLTSIYTICAFLVLGLGGAVFNGFRISLGTAVCTVPASVFAALEFAKLLPDPNGLFELNAKFYWAHLLPILAMAVCAVSMLVIELRAAFLLKRSYLKISERLYAEYSSHSENLSEEEWEEFLKNYDPRPSKKNK